MIALTLPLAPTINHYYGVRRTGRSRYMTKDGLAYRKAIVDIVAEAGHATMEGRIALFVAIHPANRCRQDIDNRIKSLADALTHAGVWLDDSQIDDLHIVRREVIKGGLIKVVITEIT